MKTMKRYFLLLLAMLLLLSAAGCSTRGAKEKPPAETEAPASTVLPNQKRKAAEPPAETEAPVPTEEPEPAYRNPFNGEGMDEPLTARPFTLMFDNHPQALPHCGVSQADILYEVLAEGGLTRMMGVFSDIESAEKLGPVRSIRPYFLDIAISYGAVIGHAGGSDAAYSRIRAERLNNIDGVRSGYSFAAFYRDQERRRSGADLEHTLFTTGESLVKCAEERGYILTVDADYSTGLRFVKDGTPGDGDTAEKVTLDFGGRGNVLSYDAASGCYTMHEHNTDYVDGNTGEKVGFRNLLVIFAPTAVLDNYGRLSINTTAGGGGFFACGGKYVPITWTRSEGGVFHYDLENGSGLKLGAGRSYIAILPANQGSAEFE